MKALGLDTCVGSYETILLQFCSFDLLSYIGYLAIASAYLFGGGYFARDVACLVDLKREKTILL